MSHKVFIPITDEVLYNYPELITSPLRPYHVDNPCYHWMATIETADEVKADEGKGGEKVSRKFDHTMSLDKPDFQIDSRLA